MKRLALKTTLLTGVLLLALGCVSFSHVQVSTGAARQPAEELKAEEALTRSGVPLQRDVRRVVRWIEADKGELNDEAMGYLPGLPKLEWLEIGGGSVTARGLAPLKNCLSLKRLYIHDIDLAGDELEWLSGHTALEALSLQRTGINGSVLKNIKAADALKVLNLSGNDINDKDMDAIALFSGLEVLALANTKITGAGIAKLEGMARLNELNVAHCGIQDFDLEYFLSMPNLRIVYAEGCGIGDMAVEQMRYRFPMLAIFR